MIKEGIQNPYKCMNVMKQDAMDVMKLGTKTYLLCSLTVGLDLGLETSASTLEFLPLSNLAK